MDSKEPLDEYYGHFRIDAFYVWMGIASQKTFLDVYLVKNSHKKWILA